MSKEPWGSKIILPIPKREKKSIVKPRIKLPLRERGKIARMPEEARREMEKEIVTGVAISKVARKYAEHGITQAGLYSYRNDVLKPAIRHAARKAADEKVSEVGEHIHWLITETKDSIDAVKGRKVGKDGNPLPAESPRVHGTVFQLLGAAKDIVRILGEFTGELGDGKPPASPQGVSIKVINIPKIGEHVTGVQVEIGKPDYERLQLQAPQEEDPLQTA